MSTALECNGIFMCCIGWLMTIISLVNHYWKTSMLSGITSMRQFQNLWQSCSENHNSISRCQKLDMQLPLPAHVVACRILMIVSLLLGLSTVCIRIRSATEQVVIVTRGIFCLLGVESFVVLFLRVTPEADPRTSHAPLKQEVIRFLSAGLCCMTAVSWYAYKVFEDNNLFFKFEMGVGLYLGWPRACFSIMGGGMLCSCNCRGAGNKKSGFRGNQPATIYTRADGSTQETDMSHV